MITLREEINELALIQKELEQARADTKKGYGEQNRTVFKGLRI